jgi:ribonuclease HII
MIIGIDEVGRGCWAGPLVAAAVGLADGRGIVGLNDSKKLSEKMRLQLTSEIQKATDYIGIGWVWPKEINALGLTESVRLAMKRAYNEIFCDSDEIIIDGNYNYLSHIANATAVIKADGSVESVSAASIIAKVTRDQYMKQIAEKYPEYGFEKHVGYGTKQHIAALEKYGITPIHRINYKPIQKIMHNAVIPALN